MKHKPDFLKTPLATTESFPNTLKTIRQHQIHTVCTEAACPNRKHCWSKNHAAFLLLGPNCTRHCRFCNIQHLPPKPPDLTEPLRIAQAVAQLSLKHVVLTSVTRDDLPDGGAKHFALTITNIRKLAPQTTIEILTPDFQNKPNAPTIIADAKPDIFNHNLETVPRLYPTVRPEANYQNSLQLFDTMKKLNAAKFLKSGLMLGLSETKDEILETLKDLRNHHVQILTLGQYLQPSAKHLTPDRYLEPEEFDELAKIAKNMGFIAVSASPLTRSSFMAELTLNEALEYSPSPTPLKSPEYP